MLRKCDPKTRAAHLFGCFQVFDTLCSGLTNTQSGTGECRSLSASRAQPHGCDIIFCLLFLCPVINVFLIVVGCIRHGGQLTSHPASIVVNAIAFCTFSPCAINWFARLFCVSSTLLPVNKESTCEYSHGSSFESLDLYWSGLCTMRSSQRFLLTRVAFRL